MGTSARQVRDEWVLTTHEGLLTPDQIGQLKAAREDSYWEAATRRGWTTDDLILSALSKRFRMKIANLSLVSQQAKELVPEQLMRKYRVLPLQISDSILDIATADPYDLDCERTLAFALGETRGTERPVIQLVDRIVAEAIQSRASDILLEPEEGGVSVRYRIDGVL